jgi:beta-glucuronidase
MGCNTIRIYHPSNINVDILRDLYDRFGIMAIMGNMLGAYTVDTGVSWENGTDYTDRNQLKKMRESVRDMVLKYKDEPFVLMWMLGNENDSAGSSENSTLNNTNARFQPEAYARFVDKMARMIKNLDPDHPVVVCNGSYKLMPYYAKYAQDIDVIGMNAYTGSFGFGTLWNRLKIEFDRPVLITEYGCDCYDQNKKMIDEDFQALYHRRSWQDIVGNSYFGRGAGNAIGGVVFTWLDKWWVCGSPKEHDTELGAWRGPTKCGYFHDEWMGMCGQGDGSKSPFLRQLRKVYFVYKDELWNKSIEELERAKQSRVFGENPANAPANMNDKNDK